VAMRAVCRAAAARGADLHCAAMRARLGAITGGAEGDDVARTAATWMRRENVRDAERMIGAILPGSEPR
jgi:hypothetical protein